ncbi:hypothetical protein EC973_001253 [Apophysomyces ossiformis]|uniref:Uncharacterized protein n=1 Tax=Apophysomyces ossiformis TaxID=679940 RepID=A0A8H7BTZ2_9FUNG|nr:hypothetical protein EC973_001253 [Apophysomyces ossiformis]
MTDNWDRTIFDKELKAILETKLPVSASKITALQALATAHPHHHNYITQCIIRFIETAPPDYRLAGLYVIDAISRAVQKQVRKRAESGEGGPPMELENYLKRFAIIMKNDALRGCFEPCSPKDKEKVKKTLDFWEQGGIYPKDVVQYVKHSFMNSQAQADQTDDVSIASPPPVIDTASLLATLSSLTQGSLGNPVAPAPQQPVAKDPTKPLFGDDDDDDLPSAAKEAAALPPALARLLGGLVSTPPTAQSTIPPSQTAPVTTTPPYIPVTPPASAHVQSLPPAQPQVQQKPVALPASDPRIRPGGPDIRPPMGVDPRLRPGVPPQAPLPQANDPRQFQPAPAGMQRPYMNMNMPPFPAPMQQRPVPPPQQQQQQPWVGRDQSMSGPRPPRPVWNEPPPREHYDETLRPRNTSTPLPGPISDPSLPKGCIRVLTRTLFVGPLPDEYDKADVVRIFSRYGELGSVILSRKPKGKCNGFLKFITRAAVERAKYESAGLALKGVPVKVCIIQDTDLLVSQVNWAYGFGPKKLFSYERGESIIPLNQLSEEEQASLVTAPVGGFRGSAVRDQMTIEEPEVQYRPEWKKDGSAGEDGGRGWRGGPPPPLPSPQRWEQEGMTKRPLGGGMNDDGRPKRRRFENEPGPGGYMPPPPQFRSPFVPHQQQQDFMPFQKSMPPTQQQQFPPSYPDQMP